MKPAEPVLKGVRILLVGEKYHNKDHIERGQVVECLQVVCLFLLEGLVVNSIQGEQRVGVV